ncbi:uncharacterized protein [Glycine max]|uniref:uncharacterized protein n=1 Tax=Glycine max TaxID=3847 RepID=UPI001B356259|nr:uncharacterized protein LOC100802049 [Glycine max]
MTRDNINIVIINYQLHKGYGDLFAHYLQMTRDNINIAIFRKGGNGYVMRVRLASFFTGAAAASFLGLYTLHKDYKVAHQSFTQQMNDLHKSLEGRISSLEKLKQTETSEQVEATE